MNDNDKVNPQDIDGALNALFELHGATFMKGGVQTFGLLNKTIDDAFPNSKIRNAQQMANETTAIHALIVEGIRDMKEQLDDTIVAVKARIKKIESTVKKLQKDINKK